MVQRSRQHRRSQLEQGHTTDRRSHGIAVRLIEPPRVVSHLVFEETA
jgi:hypothetical protein